MPQELPPYKEYVPQDIQNIVNKSIDEKNGIKFDKRKLPKSPEHLRKLHEGRAKHFAKQKELKELMPKVDRLQESIYAMAKNQDQEIEIKTKGPVNIKDARDHIIKKIWNKKDKIIEAKIDQATGLYYTSTDGKHVYTSKPDAAASEYLLNQLIGKPTESLEVKQITKLQVDF